MFKSLIAAERVFRFVSARTSLRLSALAMACAIAASCSAQTATPEAPLTKSIATVYPTKDRVISDYIVHRLRRQSRAWL